ncbi:Serine/threonine-protein kinase PrkC [Rubripirellula tenax]|uniref:non-specific serine/threonine protein kinase n=1 Tax=Rubripirellula tenax TaxID=2528015 RepID=A0A5C6FE15_9BACT|nr:serine/threonine-protein kinase [Rubripirellula tenax]TWU58992.1 Serine/threonine-protein kinase PrkC [Rubripirellula tenax]
MCRANPTCRPTRLSWQEAQNLLAADEYDSPEQVAAITSLLSGEQDSITKQQTADVLSREIRGWLDPTDDPQSLGRFAGYEIVGIVGHGGMGIVLKGFESSLNRYVAIKVLAPRLATNGNARKRFAREAQAAAAVRHDNVIAIHRVDDWHGLPFLVMPYVGGISLQKRIDIEGSLNIEQTLRVGVQIASGLAAAHAQGLVHRDIKPANILLEQGVERVTITDFGLARAADDASVTRTGVIAGTPQYMSPEQAEARQIDARSDLFSLGSVLYAMATGRPPFRGDHSFEVLKRIVNEPTRPIREIEASVPEWFEQLVARLHCKFPNDRFDSAEQVANLLEDCLAHVQQPTTTPLPEAVANPVAELAKSFGSRSTKPASESLGDFRYPPIGKLIVAAAFAFSLIFAGVLIVLELNKGTLTIESEVDDIPIRVMRGKEVVQELKVSHGSESTRISAGDYVIEIAGKFSGVSVEAGGKVSLERGGSAVVNITTEELAHAERPIAEAAQRSEKNAREQAEMAFKMSEAAAKALDEAKDTERSEAEPDAIAGEQGKSNSAADMVAGSIVTSQTEGKDDTPSVGSLILLKLTGDVAREYARETGQLRHDETPPEGMEIETTAEVAQRLSDGRLRIEHLSPPRVVFTDNWYTMLLATVQPSAISRETTPRGTVVSASPGAAIESMTNDESQPFRLTLSDLDDVVMKPLIQPLPAKEAALSELQFKRTAAALNHLLRLNGDGTTHIEKVGGPTNFMGIKDVEAIRSHGKDYVAVAARRFPPEVEQPFGQHGAGMIFLFDKKGILEAKFGGNLGADGVNSEDVQLLSLGTEDQWFVVIHVFEPRGPLEKTQRIHLVEDGFPLAFQIHAIKSMAWTSAPYENDDFGYKHFFNPNGIPNREFGKGHDGREYHSILGWDAKERIFRGPSQLIYKDKLLFHVNFSASTRFHATDRPRDDQTTEDRN